MVNKINSLTSDEIIKIRYNSIKLYNDKFSNDSIENCLYKFIDFVSKEKDG